MKLELGHVVLSVRSLDVSVPYYCRVLGMRERRRGETGRLAFLTFGERDHDIGLLEGDVPMQPHDESRVGLAHVAFRLGDRIDKLYAFKKHLDTLGLAPQSMIERPFSASIYVRDPDGIELEVYVDFRRARTQE